MILIAFLGLFCAPASAARLHTLCLQPMGPHEGRLLGPVARGIGQAYGFAVRTLPSRDLPRSAWYPPRGRYRAERVLDALRAQRTSACDVLLAFTSVDVSTRMGEHADWGVLGLSYTGENVSVVSSFRMHRSADRHRLVQRAVKVSLHEIGHAIGLPHRDDGAQCLMNDAHGAIASIDRARGTLCPGERAAAEALLRHALPRAKSLDWNEIEK